MNTLVIDVETGGLNPKEHAICSITMKAFGKGTYQNIFIKPQPNLIYTPEAMALTGISMDYLAQFGVDEETAIKNTISFVRGNFDKRPHILGHNVDFDLGFMNELFKRKANITFNDLIHVHKKDTMLNSLFLRDSGVVDLDSLSLGCCYTKICKKNPLNAHSSHGDVLMTEELYLMQMKLIGGNKNA